MDSLRFRSWKNYSLGWWNVLAAAWFPGVRHFESLTLRIQLRPGLRDHAWKVTNGHFRKLTKLSMTIFSKFWSWDRYPICIHGSRPRCFTCIAEQVTSEVDDMPLEGLPYIPRVHLSEGSLVRSPLKWLWSEEPMVRRSFIPKFLYSESFYVPKIPYSERPSTIWILCYEDSLVRSSSSPKDAMFRTSIFRKSPLPHTVSILRRSFSPKFPQF